MRSTLLSLLTAASLAQFIAHPVWAALGDSPTVADTSGHSLKLAVRQSAAAWRVQDVTLASGTVVHEYVATATGKVFAISWNGPVLPDLRQFLGASFGRFQQAAATPVVRHRLVRLEASDLRIQSAGRMRHFVGHALLTAQLPAGFTEADLE